MADADAAGAQAASSMTDAGAPAPASSMADAGVPATASSMADAGVPAAAAPLAPLAPLAPWAPSTPSAPAGQPSSPAAASVSSTPPAPALRAALLPHGDPRTAASPGDPWYLCYFIHRLLDFRLPDVEAVAETCGAAAPTLTWRMPFGDEPMSPFYYLRVPGGDAVVEGIARRTTLARGFMEVWGEGATFAELQAAVQAAPASLTAQWLSPERSFKVAVEGYGHKVSDARRIELIHQLGFVPFQGSVNLANPDVVFWLLVARTSGNSGITDTIPDRMYFGRQVAVSDRRRNAQYALGQRKYIGPTSMDTEMAFIMANMAKVMPGHFVFDPFAGTGSILVAAAVFGAAVAGADIDIRVIAHGKAAERGGGRLDIYTNFEQYGMGGRLAGLLRMDNHRHALRPGLEGMFHAIIGDPPYGVRAGGRKSMPKEIEIRDRDSYIPSTSPYSMGECLRDLLDMAARLLVEGGRLVYFFPANPNGYDDSELPTHPALQLVANSEQLLTLRYCRRLVTMQKVRPYDVAAATAHHAACGDPTLPIDRLHDVVYDKESNPLVLPPGGGKRRFRSKAV